jgi:acetyl esterase/lipase
MRMIILLALLCVAIDVTAAPRVVRDLPYVFSVSDPAARRYQSLDLVIPSATRPPLVVFVHGGFWTEPVRQWEVGPRIAQALVDNGAAVALVRYRLSPKVRHPAHVRDVAAALAFLKRSASLYGYDPERIYVLGHSSGATIAAQLALNPVHFKDYGLTAVDVAGFILLSGIYDLGPQGPLNPKQRNLLAPIFGADESARRAASPVSHARPGPPLLVLSAENDLPGFSADARRFARALRAAGHKVVDEIVIPKQNHLTLADFTQRRNLAVEVIEDFLKLKPMPPAMAEVVEARRFWQEPPFSTEPFWNAGVAVRTFPVDTRLRSAIQGVYGDNSYDPRSYLMKQYHALDLLAYLDSRPREKVGAGEYLIVTNVRGEQLYWKRSVIAPYRPVLVIGVDDERDLFRLTTFYKNHLEYSWKPERPPLMVRSLGGFIHFLKQPPESLRPPTQAMYALTLDSFRLAATDPLAGVGELPRDVREVMEYRNACFSCHAFRGVGARAGHVTAAGGAFQGGFGLPLESYPPEVWRRFIFDHETSAKMINVRPNAVKGPVAEKLYDLVVEERKKFPESGK